MSALLKRLSIQSIHSWRNNAFRKFSTQMIDIYDENRAMNSMKTLLNEIEDVVQQTLSVNDRKPEEIMNDPRWNLFMEEIRRIDPYALSIEFSITCCDFAEDYLTHIVNSVDDLNQIKDRDEDDSDVKLVYSLYTNIIERTQDQERIKDFLDDLTKFTFTIKDKDNFEITVDRLLTNHVAAVHTADLLEICERAILMGSWELIPRLQQTLMDRRIFWEESESYGYDQQLHDTENVYHILQRYDFDAAQFDPDSVDHAKFIVFKERLRMDTVEHEGECMNKELLTDWKTIIFDYEQNEGIFRVGAMFVLQFGDGRRFVGLCSNEGMHFRCISVNRILHFHHEIAEYIARTEELILKKNSDGNYEGLNYIHVNRSITFGNTTKQTELLLRYATECILKLD